VSECFFLYLLTQVTSAATNTTTSIYGSLDFVQDYPMSWYQKGKTRLPK